MCCYVLLSRYHIVIVLKHYQHVQERIITIDKLRLFIIDAFDYRMLRNHLSILNLNIELVHSAQIDVFFVSCFLCKAQFRKVINLSYYVSNDAFAKPSVKFKYRIEHSV